MSSNLFTFENSFSSDHFPAFACDPDFDPNPLVFSLENHDPPHGMHPLDRIASALLSSSPPEAQLENLSLSRPEKTEHGVKTEECPLGLDGFSGYENCFSPQTFDGAYASAVKFMQRSYSSGFVKKRDFTARPRFISVLDSSENTLCGGEQMRRVCSTGDLQKAETNMQARNVLVSTTEKPLMEDTSFKARKYSAEEKKERIDRYRAKRTQRNFNKTVKYACRKTLADSRPRIRGRFARNDEAGEIPKASMFHGYEEEDDVWVEGFEYENGNAEREMLMNMAAPSTLYQNYSFS